MDGRSAENAGAIFCPPWRKYWKCLEQFPVNHFWLNINQNNFVAFSRCEQLHKFLFVIASIREAI